VCHSRVAPHFDAGGDQPLDDQDHDQILFPAALASDQRIQAELANHRQESFDVTVRQGLARGEEVLRRDQFLVAQEAAQGFDLCLWPMREVGKAEVPGKIAPNLHISNSL